MPVVVSMLRGVNVGVHHRIKMDALRAVYESLKLRDPRTYVQSGNVIFSTGEQNLDALAGKIEAAIEKAFGFHSDVILRTAAEMKDVIARNPFAKRDNIEPNKLLVTFLKTEPPKTVRDQVLAIKADPEELHIRGRELYIYYPNGMARPKLSLAAVERILKIPGTGRNWNSVTRMLEMAEHLASE